MKRIELSKIADSAALLDQSITREFGSITLPSVVKLSEFDAVNALTTTQNQRFPGSTLIPLAQNIDVLTNGIVTGRSFGVLLGNGRVYPGIITERTVPGELHVTYLQSDPLDPRDMKLSRLQHVVLGGGLAMQNPTVGTHGIDTTRGVAAELGHTYLGLKAVTDPTVMASLSQGQHVVHEWTGRPSGIAPAVTKHTSGVAGMFDVRTDSGVRRVQFEDITLRGTDRAMLIDHPVFHESSEAVMDDIDSSKLTLGLGIVAAQTQLGQTGPMFESRVMSALSAL